MKQKLSMKAEAKERRRAKQAQVKKQLEEKGIFAGKRTGKKRTKKEDWLQEGAVICFVCGDPVNGSDRKTYPASRCSDEIICHRGTCEFSSERFMNSLISLTWHGEQYFSGKQPAFDFDSVDSYTSSDGIRRRTLRFKNDNREQEIERRGGMKKI